MFIYKKENLYPFPFFVLILFTFFPFFSAEDILLASEKDQVEHVVRSFIRARRKGDVQEKRKHILSEQKDSITNSEPQNVNIREITSIKKKGSYWEARVKAAYKGKPRTWVIHLQKEDEKIKINMVKTLLKTSGVNKRSFKKSKQWNFTGSIGIGELTALTDVGEGCISGSVTGNVYIWNKKTGKRKKLGVIPEGPVDGLTASKQKNIVIAFSQMHLKAWNYVTGENVFEIKISMEEKLAKLAVDDMYQNITSVSLTADGTHLITGHNYLDAKGKVKKSVVKLWALPGETLVDRMSFSSKLIQTAVSPEKKFLAVATDQEIHVLEHTEERISRKDKISNINSVNTITFSHNGKFLYYNQGEKLFSYDVQGETSDFTGVQFSGINVVSTSRSVPLMAVVHSRSVSLVDTSNFEKRKTRTFTRPVPSIDFNKANNHLIVGETNRIVFWNHSDNTVTRTYSGHMDSIKDAGYWISTTPRVVALHQSGSGKTERIQRVKIWDVSSGKLVGSKPIKTNASVEKMAVLTSSNKIALAYKRPDQEKIFKIEVYTLPDFELVTSYKPLNGTVYNVQARHGSKNQFVVFMKLKIKIINVDTDQVVKTIKLNKRNKMHRSVHDVSRDGSLVAAAIKKGNRRKRQTRVYVWDISESSKRMLKTESYLNINLIEISPRNKYLLFDVGPRMISTEHSTIWEQKINPPSEKAKQLMNRKLFSIGSENIQYLSENDLVINERGSRMLYYQKNEGKITMFPHPIAGQAHFLLTDDTRTLIGCGEAGEIIIWKRK